MANHVSCSFPLYERVAHKNSVKRGIELIILFLLLALLTHRLLYLDNYGVPWLIALICESCFALIWVLNMNAKWNPVEYKTYPENLTVRSNDLPPVDILVTTADPILEPPIIVVNTVLSLMAVDYPAHKLACYVSDDGGSALTYFSLVEASKFAKLWVPFCKKYGVLVRAPFRHFYAEEGGNVCSCDGNDLYEFEQERQKMKEEYEKLVQKIEEATRKPLLNDLNTKEYEVFSNIDPKNHESIIKVIWENKDASPDGLPHLVYISREKRPKHPHHYKAGAMNVLTRVSGLMTNAPFILNLDCDMYVNNPLVVKHAMCLLLGPNERDSGFVQSPQFFYNGPVETMMVWQQYLVRGMAGLQGPFYIGTNCFHRRKIIYGSLPTDKEIKGSYPGSLDELKKRFGESVELVQSVAIALSGLKDQAERPSDLSSVAKTGRGISCCDFEHGTSWGKEFGWVYGGLAEDLLTGLKIQSRGWGSILCTPDPLAFLGCAPADAPIALAQQKRWATGLLENLFSRYNPIFATLTGKLRFRQCLVYVLFNIWGLRSIIELLYAALPAYCIITNSAFLPKGLALLIPLALFTIFHLYSLSEYLSVGASVRAWWEAQKMARIGSATGWLFGLFSVMIKLVGLSEPVFDITHKGEAASTSNGGFTFNDSPIFLPATTISLVHLAALATMLLGFQLPSHGVEFGIGEISCSLLIILCFWCFIEGMFKKGRHGIPASTIYKSAVLALLFVNFCRWTTLV